jgi:hypothetical protein
MYPVKFCITLAALALIGAVARPAVLPGETSLLDRQSLLILAHDKAQTTQMDA